MDFDTLYLKVLKYLNYRPRSEKEIRDYLKRKLSRHPELDSGSYASNYTNEIPGQARDDNGDTSGLIDVIIHKLKEQKFLNDEEFAKMWVRSRTSYKPKGEYVIQMELRQKGISEELIEEALSNSESRQQSDLELALEILQNKQKKYKEMDRQERFRKAGSMLARRGFSLDVIKASIDKVFGK